MEREGGNGERIRKWRKREEIEREWGKGERFTLYISSFSLYFLPLYPFPISKIVTFCRKMLNTALLSRMSQKTYHTCYEKIILGRIRREKALQVVPACWVTRTSIIRIFHLYVCLKKTYKGAIYHNKNCFLCHDVWATLYSARSTPRLMMRKEPPDKTRTMIASYNMFF